MALDPNTTIHLGENGLPDMSSLFLAGEDGLKFLFGYAKKVFGPEFDAAKAEFAKALVTASKDVAHTVEKGVEDAVNTEVTAQVPVLEPVAKPILDTVEKDIEDLTDTELEKLQALVNAKLDGTPAQGA